MGTFATIRMPLDLTRRSGADIIARMVVETFAGTRNVELDAAAGAVTFEMHFPGNLSALVRQLHGKLIPTGPRADVSLPLQSLAPELLEGGSDAVRQRLLDGPEIWDVELERGDYVSDARLNGDRVEASIVASTSAMHQMYDVLLSFGLMAAASPSPAGRGT